MSGFILDILNYLLWPFSLIILGLVYGFQYIFNWLAGNWLFNGILQDSKLNALWAILILLGGLFLIVSLTVLVIKSMHSTKLAHLLNKGFYTTFLLVFAFIMLPVFVVNVIMIVGGFVSIIFNSMGIQDVSFAQLIHMMGYTNINAYNQHAGEPWDTPPTWGDYNIFSVFIGGIAAAFMLFHFCEILIKRIFNLLMLWFAFPFISAQTVYEGNSSKILAWKDSFLASLFTLIVALFAIMAFMILTPFALDKARVTFQYIPYSGWVWNAFLMVWVIAGGKAVQEGILMVVNLISTNANPYVDTKSIRGRVGDNSKKLFQKGKNKLMAKPPIVNQITKGLKF